MRLDWAICRRSPRRSKLGIQSTYFYKAVLHSWKVIKGAERLKCRHSSQSRRANEAPHLEPANIKSWCNASAMALSRLPLRYRWGQLQLAKTALGICQAVVFGGGCKRIAFFLFYLVLRCAFFSGRIGPKLFDLTVCLGIGIGHLVGGFRGRVCS